MSFCQVATMLYHCAVMNYLKYHFYASQFIKQSDENIVETGNSVTIFAKRIQSLVNWFKLQDASNVVAIAFACLCDWVHYSQQWF